MKPTGPIIFASTFKLNFALSNLWINILWNVWFQTFRAPFIGCLSKLQTLLLINCGFAWHFQIPPKTMLAQGLDEFQNSKQFCSNFWKGKIPEKHKYPTVVPNIDANLPRPPHHVQFHPTPALICSYTVCSDPPGRAVLQIWPPSKNMGSLLTSQHLQTIWPPCNHESLLTSQIWQTICPRATRGSLLTSQIRQTIWPPRNHGVIACQSNLANDLTPLQPCVHCLPVKFGKRFDSLATMRSLLNSQIWQTIWPPATMGSLRTSLVLQTNWSLKMRGATVSPFSQWGWNSFTPCFRGGFGSLTPLQPWGHLLAS